ncbi:MAG: aldo/keto reductase [Pirellulaceae bacterium]|nr:aldo/keto reductase [Pirellulaceae bacterium]
MSETNRRQFLQAAAASLAAAGFGSRAMANQQNSSAGIPTRPLGKTGQQVAIVGLGGYHIGTVDEKQAIAIMHEAIDQGMTFFDNAWDYHNGRSEEFMGKALASGGRRQKVFLMTKVCARDYRGVQQHLDDSLRRLQTDVIDLWQFHEINWDIDSVWLYEQGGLKAAVEAQKAGKVRYIGFTGHRDHTHLLKMLSTPHEWDTVQMPVNVLDAHYRPFQEKVLPELNRRKIGTVGMKALAGGVIPSQLNISAELCRRFALTLPISTLVCGISSRENLLQDLAMARDFKPVSRQELDDLLAQTAQPGSDGKLERYKTTRYGSAYHFQQHGE